jgi:DNA (cytosine-5)-methyltransferase 1
MRLLDLFCGAGGAAVGYHRAGFDEIVGVDIAPQPHYPFAFVQADAMAYPLDGFDLIHASPPCQGYSRMRHLPWLQGKEYPRLIAATWERLSASGTPWIIENVEDAPMPYSVTLCGASMGLALYRHRRFGSSHLLLAPPHLKHKQVITPGRMIKERGRVASWERATRLPAVMGCPWMTQKEVGQAIPPAYTEWLGRQIMAI